MESGALTKHMDLSLMQAQQNLEFSNRLQSLQKFDETAQEFEAMFVTEMMKPMFEGIETDGPFGGGKGEEIFRGLLNAEYGKLIAETGSIGMKDTIKAELIKMQEAANATR